LYVLPAHFWANRDFATPLRDFPVGSGAYRVSAVDWGNSVTYTRVQNWWAAGIPADRGFDNFDTVTELYFRDKSALLQAFKAGELDEHVEDSAAQWNAAQTWPEVRDGHVRLELVPETLPAGITGLVMNTRRPEFADARVRKALTLAFDAEWTNRALFGGFLRREHSYFSNSAMASSGLPSPDELKLLAPYRRGILPAVFTTPFTLPVTDGSGYNLPELEQAMALLNAAGWQVRNFVLVNAAGQQMSFEILLDDPKYERIVIPYAHDLGLLGIAATVRTVDPATYLRREQDFDFDMTEAEFPVSDDPGSEQAAYWGCAAARTPGSENLAGVCSPAIDATITAETAAPNADAKRTAIHALDRLLLNGWYLVPWFSAESERLEYWPSRVTKPSAPLQVGVDTSLWWAK
jgi:microcin C transport system substrate-binding protein